MIPTLTTLDNTLEAEKAENTNLGGSDRFARKEMMDIDTNNNINNDGDSDGDININTTFRPQQKIEPSRFSRPTGTNTIEKSSNLRLNVSDLILSRYCGSTKKRLVRPGGSKLKPKRFIGKSQRVPRKKKIGNRISYSRKELVSLKPQHRLFPLNCEMIENVFEEGLGIDDAELDLLINISNGKTKSKSKSRPRRDYKSKPTPILISKSKSKTTVHSVSDSGMGIGIGSGGSTIPHLKEDSSLSPSKGKVTGGYKGLPGRGKRTPLQIFRGKVVLLLSKVAIGNFTTIQRQLIELFVNEVNKVEELKLLVSLIFNKTVNDQQYGPLYAQLCVELSGKEKQFTVENDSDGTRGTRLGFKNVLVQQCQVEFQKGLQPAKIDENSTAEDIRLAEVKQKRILMGTMKFIGELYNCQLLRSYIIIHCLNELIHEKGSEIDIEAAVGLLETVGKQLDTERLNVMASYYRKLVSIHNNSKRYNPRIRILVLNLLDYRRNGWKSSTKSSKTTDEIRHEIGIGGAGGEGKGGVPPLEADEAIDSYMRTIQYADHVDFSGDHKMNDQDGMSAMSGMNLNLNMNMNGAGYELGIRTRGGRRRYITTSSQRRRITSNQGLNQMANRPRISGMSNSPTKASYNSNQKPSPQRFLMKSKNVETSSSLGVTTGSHYYDDEYDNNNNNNNNNYDNNDEKEKELNGTRPCSDGIELSDETRDNLFHEYFISKKSESQFLTAISNFKLNRSKFLQELLSKALDRSCGEQERASRLMVTMCTGNYLSVQEICQCFSEYFEFYTMEVVDIPTLANEISNILSILIGENIVSMSNIKEWLTKDGNMLKKPFNRRSGDPDLTFGHEFLAALFKAIRDRNCDRSDYVELMLRANEGKFDLNFYFKNDQVRQKWNQQWKMNWLRS